MKGDSINLNLAIPAPHSLDHPNYQSEIRKSAEERLYREASYNIIEKLKNGQRIALTPHKITESSIRRGYGDETVLNLEIEVYHVRDSTNYDVMGDKMRELLERDAYVRVPYGYAYFHTHFNQISPLSFLDSKSNEKERATTSHGVILEPVLNSSGKELGRMGKCEGCGKVFYCIREEI